MRPCLELIEKEMVKTGNIVMCPENVEKQNTKRGTNDSYEKHTEEKRHELNYKTLRKEPTREY
jgi:hypothetical protein